MFNTFCQNNNIDTSELIATEADNLIQELHRKDLVEFVHDKRQRGVLHKKLSDIQSIILIVRNSLAHGMYVIQIIEGEPYYLMENRMPLKNTNGKFRGRLYIKQRALLDLIDLIKSGPKKNEEILELI